MKSISAGKKQNSKPFIESSHRQTYIECFKSNIFNNEASNKSITKSKLKKQSAKPFEPAYKNEGKTAYERKVSQLNGNISNTYYTNQSDGQISQSFGFLDKEQNQVVKPKPNLSARERKFHDLVTTKIKKKNESGIQRNSSYKDISGYRTNEKISTQGNEVHNRLSSSTQKNPKEKLQEFVFSSRVFGNKEVSFIKNLI